MVVCPALRQALASGRQRAREPGLCPSRFPRRIRFATGTGDSLRCTRRHAIGTPQRYRVADQPEYLPLAYLTESLSELTSTIRAQSRLIEGRARIVDEYRTQTVAGDSETVVTLLPEFERLWVRIEHIIITGPFQGSSGAEFEAQVTSPGANVNIVNVQPAQLPPPGNYTVNWTVDLDGTVSATDVNNAKLVWNGATVENAVMDGAVGRYSQLPYQLTIPTNNAGSLQIKSIAAGTVGAVYTGAMNLVPVNGYPVTLQLGDRIWNLVIPGTGVLEMSPKVLLLSSRDLRQLTATFPGQYTLELLGYADVRNRE